MVLRNKKKTGHSAIHDDNRSKLPFYTGGLRTLKLENGQTLCVHRQMLERFPKLASENSFLDTVDMKHLSIGVGHIIVHYLYTGNYEDLLADKEQVSSISEMTTALQVYATARTYELPALEALAKEEIQRLGHQLPLTSIIDIVENTYARPGEDDTWFPTFVASLVQTFYESMSSMSGTETSTGSGQKPTISQIILQSVVKLRAAVLDDAELSSDWNSVTTPAIHRGSEAETTSALVSGEVGNPPERDLMLLLPTIGDQTELPRLPENTTEPPKELSKKKLKKAKKKADQNACAADPSLRQVGPKQDVNPMLLCSARTEHLSIYGDWENCESCRQLVQHFWDSRSEGKLTT